MARGGRVFRRIVELVLDRRSAQKTERDTKEALDKGTDPKKPTQNLNAIQRGMQALRKAAVALGGVLLAVFSVRAILRFGNEVEESRRTLIRMTGASGAALRALQEDTRAVFREVPESMREVSVAVGTLNTLLGITGEQLRRTTRASLDFARANEVEVATAAELVGQIINRFGLDAEHAEGLMDRLTVAGQRTGASVTGLANNLLQAGPALSTLGFSLNEQIALMAELERRGISASEVTNRLVLSLGRFAREGARDGAEAFRMLVDSIEGAETELEAIEIATDAFGRRGAALALDIRAGVLEIEGLTAALRDADGALAETEKAAGTLADEIKTAAGALMDRLNPGIEWLARSAIPWVLRQLENLVKGIQFATDAVFSQFLRLREGFLMVQLGINRVLRRDTTEIERGLRVVRAQMAAVREAAFGLWAETSDARAETEGLAEAFDEARNNATGAANAAQEGLEEALRQERERLALIRQAVDLGIAENGEKVELLSRYRQITQELRAGNVALERRVELTREAAEIQRAMGLEAPDLTAPTMPSSRRPVGIGAQESILGERPRQEIDEFRWELANMLESPTIQRAATNAAHGITNAFRQGFDAIAREGEGLAGMFEAIFRGAGSAIMGMLAEVASSKVAENVAYAIESLAHGLRLSATGNPGAAAAFAAAKEHGAAAAAWTLLGGASAGAQGAAGGGVVSGGVPSGAADPLGRQIDQGQRAGPDITIHIDGVDPRNPRHQELVGRTSREYQERYGGRITVKGGG